MVFDGTPSAAALQVRDDRDEAQEREQEVAHGPHVLAASRVRAGERVRASCTCVHSMALPPPLPPQSRERE